MNGFPKISGRVLDCDIITVGHLKWNVYFGESADAPPRGDPSTCTSTLIRGDGYTLIVDPTLKLEADQYYFDLNRRTGLHPEDVTHCYSTHEHFDHQIGLRYFPGARWLAAPPVAERLRDSEYIDGSKVESVEGEFLSGIHTLPLPGHTLSLHGVAFTLDDKKIVVAGDGVMTKQHFAHEASFFEKDTALAVSSIRWLKENVDIVIPGHDNMVVM